MLPSLMKTCCLRNILRTLDNLIPWFMNDLACYYLNITPIPRNQEKASRRFNGPNVEGLGEGMYDLLYQRTKRRHLGRLMVPNVEGLGESTPRNREKASG